MFVFIDISYIGGFIVKAHVLLGTFYASSVKTGRTISRTLLSARRSTCTKADSLF
jgi:hypothetical protein